MGTDWTWACAAADRVINTMTVCMRLMESRFLCLQPPDWAWAYTHSTPNNVMQDVSHNLLFSNVGGCVHRLQGDLVKLAQNAPECSCALRFVRIQKLANPQAPNGQLDITAQMATTMVVVVVVMDGVMF